MEIKDWLWIRLTLYGFAFASALLMPAPVEAIPIATVKHTLMGLPVQVVVFAIGLLLMSYDPRFDDVWTRPTHHSNPLSFLSPLNVLHFLASMCFAGGLGLVAGATVSQSKLNHGLLLLATGCGIWLSARLGAWCCTHKMASPDDLSEPDSRPNQ